MMSLYLQFISAGLAAYLIGSFPTGVVFSKLKGGPDVRYHGSGNIGGTNTMRLMGFWSGAAVTVIDALKGLMAWAVAYLTTQGNPWALPLAGTMAVVGHCWPIYTRLHGGMGLATAGALILILSPLTIALAIPVWAFFYMVIFKKKYSPRCVILTIPVAIILSLLFIPLAAKVQWLFILLAVILVIRHLPEWNRVE
ncbi:MAG: glycerol-3-phosphate acyltransferase [Anaerolineae bacterium]|nr:glycerol-3-phosphate acyltransferase [Anaerolineae bacterium]